MSDIGLDLPFWMILLILALQYWYYVVIAILAIVSVGFVFRGWIRIVAFSVAGALVLAMLGGALWWWIPPG